jgi:hypothetical protein
MFLIYHPLVRAVCVRVASVVISWRAKISGATRNLAGAGKHTGGLKEDTAFITSDFKPS